MGGALNDGVSWQVIEWALGLTDSHPTVLRLISPGVVCVECHFTKVKCRPNSTVVQLTIKAELSEGLVQIIHNWYHRSQ